MRQKISPRGESRPRCRQLVAVAGDLDDLREHHRRQARAAGPLRYWRWSYRPPTNRAALAPHLPTRSSSGLCAELLRAGHVNVTLWLLEQQLLQLVGGSEEERGRLPVSGYQLPHRGHFRRVQLVAQQGLRVLHAEIRGSCERANERACQSVARRFREIGSAKFRRNFVRGTCVRRRVAERSLFTVPLDTEKRRSTASSKVISYGITCAQFLKIVIT